MILGVITLIIALVWIITATIFDIKTKEVPDWLSFSLIIIAVFINILYSIYFKTFFNLILSAIGFGAYFLFGNLMYLAKQWGGGDAKLLIGLGILIPSYPKFLLNYLNPYLNLPFLLIFILNILIAGGFYGIILSFYYAYKNKESFSKNFKLLFSKNKYFLIITSVLALAFMSLALMFFDYLILIIIFSLLILLTPLLFVFIKAVENSSMFKKLKINEIREGDWIIDNIKSNGKIIYKPKFSGISKKDILNLKRKGIKYVMIKEGFAFVPCFLIGFLMSLILGSLLRF